MDRRRYREEVRALTLDSNLPTPLAIGLPFEDDVVLTTLEAIPVSYYDPNPLGITSFNSSLSQLSDEDITNAARRRGKRKRKVV